MLQKAHMHSFVCYEQCAAGHENALAAPYQLVSPFLSSIAILLKKITRQEKDIDQPVYRAQLFTVQYMYIWWLLLFLD